MLTLKQVIPLFVTALLVPFLAVILRVAREDQKPHSRMAPRDATKYIFAAMWTPVIMLLLGGFTIAAALSKFHIAKMMATFVLSKAGTRPRTVLITNMFVAMILSMWISNVASPVLCFSIIQVCSANPNQTKGPDMFPSRSFVTSLRTPTFRKRSSLVLHWPLISAGRLLLLLHLRISLPYRTCGRSQAGAYGSLSLYRSASFPFS